MSVASDSLEVSWRWRKGERERGRRRVFEARAARCSLPRDLKTLMWLCVSSLGRSAASFSSSVPSAFGESFFTWSSTTPTQVACRRVGESHTCQESTSSSPTRRHQQQRRRRRPHLSGICFVLHSRLLLYLLASYSAYSSPILPHFFSCSPLPFMLSFSVSPHVPSPNGHSTGLPRLEKEGKGATLRTVFVAESDDCQGARVRVDSISTKSEAGQRMPSRSLIGAHTFVVPHLLHPSPFLLDEQHLTQSSRNVRSESDHAWRRWQLFLLTASLCLSFIYSPPSPSPNSA